MLIILSIIYLLYYRNINKTVPSEILFPVFLLHTVHLRKEIDGRNDALTEVSRSMTDDESTRNSCNNFFYNSIFPQSRRNN